MVKQELPRPLYVQVHPDDNVAIVVNEGGLRAGARFDSGLVLIENIPEAHKVALTGILAGAPIVRYGSVIGFAERDIVKGSWVHEGKMRVPSAPALDDLPLATECAWACAAARGLHLSRIRQRRRHRRDEEHSRHHHNGAVRRGDR